MAARGRAQRAQQQASSTRLATGRLRVPIEQVVSERLERRWGASDVRDMSEYACHPSAILSDGSYSVFAKFSEATDAFHQFEAELAGLRLLSERSGVLTPTPIGIVSVDGVHSGRLAHLGEAGDI